jgi:hypothetical protein
MYVRRYVRLYVSTNCTASLPKSRTFSATAGLSRTLSNIQIDQMVQSIFLLQIICQFLEFAACFNLRGHHETKIVQCVKAGSKWTFVAVR